MITLGLGVAMAGTGELEVLRRLRVAHANTSEAVSYGTHLATHFSLGLLFLGGGRYTLSTSNAAIACLICSVYPIFPSTAADQVHHLQALRHLWVLAVEPRCVVARDVDRKGELIFLPLKLKIKEPAKAQRPVELRTKLLTAPTLVPELATIRSVTVESPRYWPLVLDLEGNAVHRRYFVGSRTVWVKRKVGHLSYAQDPKGTKSIACRGRGAEEVAACAIDDLGRRSRLVRAAMKLSSGADEGELGGNVNALIRGFDLYEQSVGLVDYICARPAPTEQRAEPDFSGFVASALLQCLVQDKLELVPVYLQLFSSSIAPPGKRSMGSLIRFYRDHVGEREIADEQPQAAPDLVDVGVLEQIDRRWREELEEWEHSIAGQRILKDYLDSNGIQWPTEANDRGWLAEWVGVHSVPLPRTLRALRDKLVLVSGSHGGSVSRRVKWTLGRKRIGKDRFVELFEKSVMRGIEKR